MSGAGSWKRPAASTSDFLFTAEGGRFSGGHLLSESWDRDVFFKHGPQRELPHGDHGRSTAGTEEHAQSAVGQELAGLFGDVSDFYMELLGDLHPEWEQPHNAWRDRDDAKSEAIPPRGESLALRLSAEVDEADAEWPVGEFSQMHEAGVPSRENNGSSG
ncbi:hypothetical protein ANCCEY_13502 [Ancylostoma ceylanicum]|uniref:Uncharacterized protein n=1 Tax=Ancylostoma ceylanicum TaxID=53326 RepID=A0A0D6L7D8_9BILA|nr:hypothetical protein ANCCEY_13502 [Ancylostoma ceylanicum]